jgi:GT2 family glycosyltransferase
MMEAKGDILAFTDADCTPHPEWIAAGVDTLERENADLVGGRVVFEFTDEKTAAERFDASVNMRNDESVQEGVAKTANVFVRGEVTDDIGPFPQHLISGGDVHWTSAATKAGYDLAYGSEAVVTHPSRQLRELLWKQYRVGKGQVQIWRLADRSAAMILLQGLVRFPLKAINFLLGDSSDTESDAETPPDRDLQRGLVVAAAAGLCVLAMNVGRVVGLVTGK